MKNANLLIALIVGVVIGVVIGRATSSPAHAATRVADAAPAMAAPSDSKPAPAAVADPPAQASTMPRYDVEKHCKSVAATMGAASEMILSGCHEQEQQAYDGLKGTWDQLPGQLRKHCDSVARAIGSGSYAILAGCVEQERSAAEGNQKFQFRR